MKKYAIMLFVLCWSINANASMEFFTDKARGWYWHEDPPVIEEIKEPEPEIPAIPTPPPVKEVNETMAPTMHAGPAPMSAQWLRQEMPKALDAAINEPSKENVRKYFYMHRLMMDKADEFSEVAQYVTMMDPVLAEKDKAPRSDGGAILQSKFAKKNQYEILKTLANKVGIYFFFMSDCPFCHKQLPIMQYLTNYYGFSIKMISIDGLPMPNMEDVEWVADRGLARQFGVHSTPGIFFVKPNGKQPEIAEISQGFISADEFSKIAMFLSKDFGWISEEEFNSTKAVKPSKVKPKVLEKYKDKIVEEPDEVIKMIQEAIDAKL